MEALYYPNIDAPMKWIRSAALFFDTVRSFVPPEPGDHLPPDLCKFGDVTKAWEPYKPTQKTAELVDVPTERLDQAFQEIASKYKRPPAGIPYLLAEAPGGVRVKDHVFLHGCKLSQRVRERLEAHGLILAQEYAQHFGEGDWWLVHEDASDLILSCISDRLAANKGWTSITDNENCYGFNALQVSPSEQSPSQQLAKLLVAQIVPDTIETISLEKYCDLRARYAPIREELGVFLHEVVLSNGLSDIGDPKELQRKVEACARKLNQEVLNFKKSGFGSSVVKWGVFALGGVLSIASAAFVPAAAPLAAAAFGAQVVGFVQAGTLARQATPRGNMVRLLAAARAEILEPSRLKRFLRPILG